MNELNAMPVPLSPRSSNVQSNHVQAALANTVSGTRRPLSLPKKHSGPPGRCSVSVVSCRSSGESVCRSICSAPATTTPATPSREIIHEISCYPLRKKISKLNRETLYGTVRQKCSGDILVQLPFSYSSPQRATKNMIKLNDRYTTIEDEHSQSRKSRFHTPYEQQKLSSSHTVSTDCSTQPDVSTCSSSVFGQACHEITVEFSGDSPRKKISKIDLDSVFSSSSPNGSKDIVAHYHYNSPRRIIPTLAIVCDKSPSSATNDGLPVTDNGLINMTRDLLVAAERSKNERGARRAAQSKPDPIRKRNREYALRTLQAYEMRAYSSEGKSLASRAIRELYEEKPKNHQKLSSQGHRNVLHKLLHDVKQGDIHPTHENDGPCSYPEFTVTDVRPLESLKQFCSFEKNERVINL